MTPETMLDRARISIERGELSIALPILIAQWREVRAPELGELIDRIDDRVNATPFEGSTSNWLAAAVDADELVRGRLLRAIPKHTLDDTATMLEAATVWDDPRLTKILRGLLVELPWTGRRSRDGWRRIFRAIYQHDDPRLPEFACALPPTWTVGADMQRFLTDELANAIHPMTVVELPEAEALLALLGERDKPGPIETEEDLLARIYERPEDDAPRAVYADWLLERDNPRGEFISLQLRAAKDEAAAKREAALLKKHHKAWLGPLDPVVRDVKFRRGFPAVATVKFRHQRDVEQHGHHAAWATIEELSWTYSQARDDRLEWSRAMTPEMHGLRVVHDPSLTHLLGAAQPWSIERLYFRNVAATQFQALLDHPRLPALQILSVGHGVKPSWLNNITKCPPHLELATALDDLDREAFLSKAEASPLQSLTFVWRPYRARFARGGDGRLSRLDVELLISLPNLDILPRTAIASMETVVRSKGSGSTRSPTSTSR
jgi:uncharacterized protein (TIGR02996 family)